MLQSANDLKGYDIIAMDGGIGKIEECYFDDTNLVVRYIVANTGNWLTGKHYLISPLAITHIDGEKRTIHISLTKDQVIKGPGVEKHLPLSRQVEKLFSDYYGKGHQRDESVAFTTAVIAKEIRVETGKTADRKRHIRPN